MVKRECPDCGEIVDISEGKKESECENCGFIGSSKKWWIPGKTEKDQKPGPDESADKDETPERVFKRSPAGTFKSDSEFSESEKPDLKKEKVTAERETVERKKKKRRVTKKEFFEFCIRQGNDRIARVDPNRYLALRTIESHGYDETAWFDDLYDLIDYVRPDILEDWDKIFGR